MRFVRPNIIGTLKVVTTKAGTLAVFNDVKNAPNKIRIQCYAEERGNEIIEQIKAAKPGEILHF